VEPAILHEGPDFASRPMCAVLRLHCVDNTAFAGAWNNDRRCVKTLRWCVLVGHRVQKSCDNIFPTVKYSPLSISQTHNLTIDPDFNKPFFEIEDLCAPFTVNDEKERYPRLGTCEGSQG
jgi:hypothetical protein